MNFLLNLLTLWENEKLFQLIKQLFQWAPGRFYLYKKRKSRWGERGRRQRWGCDAMRGGEYQADAELV